MTNEMVFSMVLKNILIKSNQQLTKRKILKIMTKIPELYRVIHSYCSENKEILSQTEDAFCFYCKQKVNFADIDDWCDELSGKESAICPHCGIDSVVPYKIDGVYELDDKMLDEMHKYYF